jgi:hypothetical protein
MTQYWRSNLLPDHSAPPSSAASVDMSFIEIKDGNQPLIRVPQKSCCETSKKTWIIVVTLIIIVILLIIIAKLVSQQAN